MIVNLGANITVNPGMPHAGYDLVYYERENPVGAISLDWVIVEIGNCSSGSWYPVFNWYDNVLDSNTNIAAAGYGIGEQDNKVIPVGVLYGSSPYQTGIAIDVDAVAPPPGLYNCVRISSPFGGDNDAAEVDAVEVLP
jgi:hypothetical protein